MSQLQALTENLNWDAATQLYDRYLSSWTNTKAKRVTVGVAVALLVVGRTLHVLTRPPKHLRHLPHVNFWTFFYRMAIRKDSTLEIFNSMIKPLLPLQHSLYLRPEFTGWAVHASSPEACKQIFLKSDLFPKRDMPDTQGTLSARFVGTDNILFNNGAMWRKHRKLCNPAFHRSQPARLFADVTMEMFGVIDKDHPQTSFKLDLHDLLTSLTLEIIGRAAFDFEFGAIKDKNSEWRQIYDKVNADTSSLLYIFFPILDKKLLWLLPSRREAFKRMDKFTGMLNDIIDHKRRVLREQQDQGTTEEHERDLLTLMLEGELRGEGVLTNEELIHDLGIFFVANALSSAIYYLARYPEIQDKARKEVLSVLCPDGNEPKTDIYPTLEHTREFTYMNQIIKEVPIQIQSHVLFNSQNGKSLRIVGPVVHLVTPRIAQQDMYLADVFIPKGTQVNVNMYDLHHNPENWSDPFKFDPSRFDPDGEAERNAQKGLAWAPFANGSRQCIGMNFSLIEQRVVLAMMLRRYTFSLPADSIHKENFVTDNDLLTSPVNLQMTFTRRF
ncbi:cytochrome P450 [Gongronella butleri]|nr:cytochrome P450 [Gongronella butleri]